MIFGIAASVILLGRSPPDALRSRFGFLQTLIGRAVFFITMGFLILPAVCGVREDLFACMSRTSLLDRAAMIASVVAIGVGGTLLVLKAFFLRDSCVEGLFGASKGATPLAVASVVASAGMLLQGLSLLYELLSSHEDFRIRDLRSWAEALSLITILLVLGTAALISSVNNSPFVSSFLGFLTGDRLHGIFFLLMGFYTFAQFSSHAHASEMFETVCWTCSLTSMAVGVVSLVKSCL